MNLICPHCQKMVTIPDENAGQQLACPLCKERFTVPALPAAPTAPASPSLPEDIPLVPLPPTFDPPAAAPPPAAEDPVYKLAPEPARPSAPPPSPPPRREPKPAPAATEPPRSPAPPPGEYAHRRVWQLNKSLVPWVAPLGLVLLFILWFFPWTGVYPGGHAVYTQTPLQAIWAGYSINPVGEKVFRTDREIQELAKRAAEGKSDGDDATPPFRRALDAAIRLNMRMLLYILPLLLGLVLAITPLVVQHKPLRLPPALETIWPWRTAILTGAIGLATLVLLLQLFLGFGLESGITGMVEKSFSKEIEAEKTSEEQAMLDIREGLQLGRFQLHRTVWLDAAVVLQLLALAGAGLEWWLERRRNRPLPRLEVMW